MNLIYLVYLMVIGVSAKIPEGKVVNLTLGSAQEVVFEANTTTPMDIYPDEDKKNQTVKYAFYSVEVHTHTFPVILEASNVTNNKSEERFDGGLLIPYDVNRTMRVYVTNNRTSKIYGVSLGRGIQPKDPIPSMGSSKNLTKPIRPNVEVSFNDFTTKIRFQEAGSIQAHGLEFTYRSGKVFNYEVYQFWFPEGDFEVDDFVTGLTSMLFAPDIRKNGYRVENYYLDRELESGAVEAAFAAFPGTLQLFAVIATSEDGGEKVNEAVYTSGITSGCSMRAIVNKDKSRLPSWRCKSDYYLESRVIVGFGLIFGFFLAIVGHRFFTASQFVFGTFMAGVVSWPIAIGLFKVGHLVATIFAIVIGILLGLVNLAIWNCGRIVMLPTAVANALSSLLFGATIAHIASLHQSRAMMSDGIFYGTLSSVALVYFLGTIGFPRMAHLSSCSIIGSFVLACCLDHYLGSTIRYLLINFLRRCSVKNYRDVCPQLPFQDNEKIVVSVWILMTIFSSIFQYWRYRHQRPFFQSPLDNMVTVEVTPVNTDERTPLLQAQSQITDDEVINPESLDEPVAGPSSHQVVGYIEGYGAVTAPPPPFLRVYRDPRFYADRDIKNTPSRQHRKPRTVFSVLQRSSSGSSQEPQRTRGPVRDIFRPPDMNNSPT